MPWACGIGGSARKRGHRVRARVGCHRERLAGAPASMWRRQARQRRLCVFGAVHYHGLASRGARSPNPSGASTSAVIAGLRSRSSRIYAAFRKFARRRSASLRTSCASLTSVPREDAALTAPSPRTCRPSAPVDVVELFAASLEPCRSTRGSAVPLGARSHAGVDDRAGMAFDDGLSERAQVCCRGDPSP